MRSGRVIILNGTSSAGKSTMHKPFVPRLGSRFATTPPISLLTPASALTSGLHDLARGQGFSMGSTDQSVRLRKQAMICSLSILSKRRFGGASCSPSFALSTSSGSAFMPHCRKSNGARGYTNDAGNPLWQEAAQSSRRGTKRQTEEPDQHHQGCENHQCNQNDPKRGRRFDRIESHELSDRILPWCHLPEAGECNGRAAGHGSTAGDTEEAVLGLRKPHICPEPTAEFTDAVADRQRTPRHHALHQQAPREQRRGQGGGKKHRPQHKAADGDRASCGRTIKREGGIARQVGFSRTSTFRPRREINGPSRSR